MATWPVGLPQEPMRRGYQEAMADTTIVTQMDVGPPKVRRRTTAGVAPATWPFEMSSSQVVILKTFYRDTCAGGALTFTHNHQMSGGTKTWRFTGPPRITGDGEMADYTVVCQVEERPS